MLGRVMLAYTSVHIELIHQKCTDINEDVIPKRRAPAHHTRARVAELLERLDARLQPGITLIEFKRLFVMCECGLVCTRRAFSEHKCEAEVIDLTGSD